MELINSSPKLERNEEKWKTQRHFHVDPLEEDLSYQEAITVVSKKTIENLGSTFTLTKEVDLMLRQACSFQRRTNDRLKGYG